MTGIFDLDQTHLHHVFPKVENSIQQLNRLSPSFISSRQIIPPEFIKIEENNSANLPNLALRRNKIFQQINQKQISSRSFILADVGPIRIRQSKPVKLSARYSQVNPQTMPILGFGNSGVSVRVLQKLLLSNGYGVSVDGVFGPVTEIAVKAFQNRHSLSVDGVVGQRTWLKLTS